MRYTEGISAINNKRGETSGKEGGEDFVSDVFFLGSLKLCWGGATLIKGC